MPVVRRSSTSSRASSTGGSVRNKKRKMVVESESSSEEEEDFNYDEKLKKGMAMKKKKLMERQQEKTAASRQRASQPPPVESSDSSSESENSGDDLNISAMVQKGVEEKQRRFIASQKENWDKATMPPPPPNRKTRESSKTSAVVEDDANLNQSSVIADTPQRTRSSPISTRSPLSVKTRTPSNLTEVIIPSNLGKTRQVDDMAAVYDVYSENIPSAVQNSPRRSPRSQVIRSPRSIGNVVSTPINEGRMQLLDAVGLSPVVPAVTQAKHLILTAKQKQPKRISISNHQLRIRADTEKALETETEIGPEDDAEDDAEANGGVRKVPPSNSTEVIIPSNLGKTRQVEDMAAIYDDVCAENIPSAVQNSPRRSPRSQFIRSPQSIGNVISTPINEGRMQLLDAVVLSPVVPVVAQAKHLILTAKQKQPKRISISNHQLRIRADTEKAPETETEMGPQDDAEANVQVKERYVGEDVFGNYHMLKQSDLKKILRKERTDMKPDAATLKKMTVKLNHFLEDFFTHYCNNATSPHGFLTFQETFRALKGQILIPAEHTPQQFLATLKEILSPEDIARGEGVLFPTRFSQTFDTVDYL